MTSQVQKSKVPLRFGESTGGNRRSRIRRVVTRISPSPLVSSGMPDPPLPPSLPPSLRQSTGRRLGFMDGRSGLGYRRRVRVNG